LTLWRSDSQACSFCSHISESIGYQPRNFGRDDWNDPIPREVIHEQIPQAGTHQLQWKDRGSKFAVERRFAEKPEIERDDPSSKV
jgi:hypothetical protein